ncbi:DUF2683 family protein [Methanosarcina mazei]|uniref:DUF2683 domain-containing protein n=2 Tax=Methanosarcina mazei TaxID=2209 RepID=A0A0F8LEJ5_METMZ|nr:DUF2683 family protein [Methanosarcina mazei]UWJ22554.1 hypothetical protein MSMAT_1297 [Methanosarcina mazei TMA]AKB70955.1 hypothetical protein MSMAC_1065 [Methanosarcina mazei C16]KKG00255.1 hypothetical protein DU31_07470 [Methanosarcina mazei]KKG00637.1 hypothetical protein DU40_10155 [Methanosarcina mazei]KKG03895.1 hypothetical protein DU47_18170 [Methanosarcina mazei]
MRSAKIENKLPSFFPEIIKYKSTAIMYMATEYEKELMEPEIKPEFVEKAQETMKQEPIDVGTVENWKKMLNC